MSGLIKTVANIISTNLLAQATKLDRPLETLVTKESIIELAKLFDDSKISNQGLSKAIEILITSPEKSLSEVLSQNSLVQITDTSALELIVQNVIGHNPEQAEQYRAGKTQVIGFLVGQCMKHSQGKGNPKLFNQILILKLSS